MKKILSLILLLSITTTPQTFGMKRLICAFVGACHDFHESVKLSGPEIHKETTKEEDEKYDVNPYEGLPTKLLCVLEKTCMSIFCPPPEGCGGLDKFYLYMEMQED